MTQLDRSTALMLGLVGLAGVAVCAVPFVGGIIGLIAGIVMLQSNRRDKRWACCTRAVSLIVLGSAALIVGCGDRVDLSVFQREVGDQTHIFVTYRGNVQRAYSKALAGADNDDIWYLFELETAKLRSASRHSVDLAQNPDVGLVVHLTGPAVRVGPSGSNPDVHAISGRLDLESKLIYNPLCVESPPRYAFRIAMSGDYQLTVGIDGTPTAVDGSLLLDVREW